MPHLPWLEMAIVAPLLGAAWVARQPDSRIAAKRCIAIAGFSLVCAIAAWIDFGIFSPDSGEGSPSLLAAWLEESTLTLDNLSAPLVSLAALLYLLVFAVTLGAKLKRFSFPWALVSQSVLLATLSCQASWTLVALLIIGLVPPWIELRARRKPTGVYLFHAIAFMALLAVGFSTTGGDPATASGWGIVLLAVAVLIRGGVAPFHSWMPDLFEHATFGTALLFVTPMVGAYAGLRFVLPIAPDYVLRGIGLLSLVSAFYASGMALVQTEARRFFCYLFLSHAALVFVGIDSRSIVGLTGGLCVWLSISLALSGLGITLRALEARHGRLSLVRHQGLYDHTPALAVCFLLTGLASVGFPCTFGFVGTEMLVDASVHSYSYVGIVVVLVAALNGIAIVQSYFRIFTGARHISTVPLGIGLRERWAVLILAALILGGGLWPQPWVASRRRAAEELLEHRGVTLQQQASSSELANRDVKP